MVLVDPDTRRATPRSDWAEASNEASEEVTHELFRHQVESSTPPLREATEIDEALRRSRRAIGEAAAATGARAVAGAAPPVGPPGGGGTRTPRPPRLEGGVGHNAPRAPRGGGD